MQKVADTSLAAYKDIVADGIEAAHEAKILEALAELRNGGTSLMVAGMKDITYMQATRRIAKLVKEGKVVNSGRKSDVSPSGKMATIWRLADGEKKETQIIELKPGTPQLVMNF